MLTLVDLLSASHEKTATPKARSEDKLLAHPDGPIFISLPRAGDIRAAALPAEIDDCRDRYLDDTALAAAAGVAPSTRQSGNSSHATFGRGCHTNLRNAVID